MASTIARLQRASRTPFFPSHFASSSSNTHLVHLPSHRHAMMSALSHERPHLPLPSTSSQPAPTLAESPPVVVPSATSTPSAKTLSAHAASPQVAARPPPLPKAERPRPTIKATKAAITLTAEAVKRLRGLLKSPTPQLIRIGVRNKGCAGLSYHLEYVERPGKFDEVVEQDGVRVLIDSKALFSIIGSEMDWHEDGLSAKFTFKNPNIKDACGCGESFSLGS
ncbi:Iron-sulfur assembly protein 1 [Grifola frondosa]|uniref:Iron-sulfur assembly protein 1 n=1 Tax=Grifola frondosa TaxID=5627 RepID=A0A1C7MQC1_GRIFR|nr:Iron-sulfur assembly protein 1 [Grifola frondosa]